MTRFKSGDYVAWTWGNGKGHGTVQSVHTERTEIDTKGSHISRNGSNDNPAVIIKDHNGTKVIKLASELEASSE